MQLSNLAPILPALSIIIAPAKRTAHGGRYVRAYRAERTLQQLDSATLEALTSLVVAGHEVRVYALGSIFTLALNAQGEATWGTVRASRKVRNNLVVTVRL